MSMVVFVEEEYGYRNWIWMPSMSSAELEAWWKALPTVATYFFAGPSSFPGEIHQIYIEDDGFYLVKEGGGRTLEPLSEKMPLPDESWYAHIHMECDSFLAPPKSDPSDVDESEHAHEDIRFYHAGYVSAEEYYSDEYVHTPEVEAAWDKATFEHFQKILNDEN